MGFADLKALIEADNEQPTEPTIEPTNEDNQELETEEVQEQTEEVSADEVTNEESETVENTEEEEPAQDWLTSFNKEYSTDFKTPEEIKEVLKLKEVTGSLKSELEKHKADLSILEKELEEKHEATNPEKIYGSRAGYEKHLILQKAKNDGIAQHVAERIAGADINTLAPLQAIMMDIEKNVSNEKLTTEELMSLALRKSGIDIDKIRGEMEDDGEEFDINKIKFTNTQVAEIKLLAAESKTRLNEWKKVEVPEYKGYKETKAQRLADIEKRSKELLDKWGDRIDNVAKSFKLEVKITGSDGNDDSYEFVSDEFNKYATEKLPGIIVSEDIEPTNENITKITKRLENEFWSNEGQRNKALKKLIEDAKSKKEEDVVKKVINPSSINKNEPKGTKSSDDEIGAWLKRRKSVVTDLDSIWSK